MAEDKSSLELKKTIWAYLLESGLETNGEWSYYGGHWESEGKVDYYKEKYDRSNMKAILKEIAEVGVDWEHTKVPEGSQQSEFQGTFTDASRSEALLGIIVLKDGQSYKIGCYKADLRFSVYIKQFFEIANDQKRVKAIFGE